MERAHEEEPGRARYLSLRNLQSVVQDAKGARCFFCLAFPTITRESDVLADGTILCPQCGVDAVVPASEVQSEGELHAWRYLSFFDTHDNEDDETEFSLINPFFSRKYNSSQNQCYYPDGDSKLDKAGRLLDQDSSTRSCYRGPLVWGHTAHCIDGHCLHRACHEAFVARHKSSLPDETAPPPSHCSSSSRTTRRSPLTQQSPTANATAAPPPTCHRASMNSVSSANYSVPNIGPKASEASRVTFAMQARRVGQLSAKGTSTQDSARPTSVPPVKGRTDHKKVVDPTSYSKDVGKTKLCHNWEKGMCRYTNYCRFAHGQGEIGDKLPYGNDKERLVRSMRHHDLTREEMHLYTSPGDSREEVQRLSRPCEDKPVKNPYHGRPNAGRPVGSPVGSPHHSTSEGKQPMRNPGMHNLYEAKQFEAQTSREESRGTERAGYRAPRHDQCRPSASAAVTGYEPEKPSSTNLSAIFAREAWKTATSRQVIKGKPESYLSLARRLEDLYRAQVDPDEGDGTKQATRDSQFMAADCVAQRFYQCILNYVDQEDGDEDGQREDLRAAENFKTIWGARMYDRRWCMSKQEGHACRPPSLEEILFDMRYHDPKYYCKDPACPCRTSRHGPVGNLRKEYFADLPRGFGMVPILSADLPRGFDRYRYDPVSVHDEETRCPHLPTLRQDNFKFTGKKLSNDKERRTSRVHLQPRYDAKQWPGSASTCPTPPPSPPTEGTPLIPSMTPTIAEIVESGFDRASRVWRMVIGNAQDPTYGLVSSLKEITPPEEDMCPDPPPGPPEEGTSTRSSKRPMHSVCKRCDESGDPTGEWIKDHFKCYRGNSQCERVCRCKDARENGLTTCKDCDQQYCAVHWRGYGKAKDYLTDDYTGHVCSTEMEGNQTPQQRQEQRERDAKAEDRRQAEAEKACRDKGVLLFDSSKPDEATLTGAVIAPDPETLEDYLRDSISRNVGIAEPEGPPPASPGPSPPASRATTPTPPDPAEGEEEAPPPPEAAGGEQTEGEQAAPEEGVPIPREEQGREPARDSGTTATTQQQGTQEGQPEPPSLPVATAPQLPFLPATAVIPQELASRQHDALQAPPGAEAALVASTPGRPATSTVPAEGEQETTMRPRRARQEIPTPSEIAPRSEIEPSPPYREYETGGTAESTRRIADLTRRVRELESQLEQAKRKLESSEATMEVVVKARSETRALLVSAEKKEKDFTNVLEAKYEEDGRKEQKSQELEALLRRQLEEANAEIESLSAQLNDVESKMKANEQDKQGFLQDQQELINFRESMAMSENGSVIERARDRMRLEDLAETESKKVAEAEELMERLSQNAIGKQAELDRAREEVTELKRVAKMTGSQTGSQSGERETPRTGVRPEGQPQGDPIRQDFGRGQAEERQRRAREVPTDWEAEQEPSRAEYEEFDNDDALSYASLDTRQRGRGKAQRERERPPERGEWYQGPGSEGENEDARSDASFNGSSGTKTEDAYMKLFLQDHHVTLAALADSPQAEILRDVLAARSDNRGEHWNTRAFWVEGVLIPWARKLNTVRSERSVASLLRDLKNMKFPLLLKDRNAKVRGAAWQDFRSELITSMRDCFRGGSNWEMVLQMLLIASKRKSTGNPRMEGLVRTALSDKPLLKEKISQGGGYALLGADGLIWLLDDSYQTEHHGPQAAQNSWAKATHIEEGENFLIMGGRVVTAYSNFTGLDPETIHKDDHHRAVLFERVGLCLKTYKRNEILGQRVFAYWDAGIKMFLEDVRTGVMKRENMTVDRILRKAVESKITELEDLTLQLERDRGSAAPREPRRSARAREFPTLREPQGVHATIPEEYETQGDESAQPAGAVTPGIPGNYRTAPPPKSYSNRVGAKPLNDRERDWGREVEAPSGNKGHPLGKQWTDEDWRKCRIDYVEVVRLANDPKYSSMMCSFVPMTKEMKTPRLTLPKKDMGNKWGQFACLCCANRGENGGPIWATGNGQGDHPPYTCKIARRFLAEGGDSKTVRMARELQKCLVIKEYVIRRTSDARGSK